MALETWDVNSTPATLNTAWPEATDPLNKGDDHIRLLKTVVVNFWNKVFDGSKLRTAVVPAAVNSATAGSGFGGFRYQVITNADSTKTLRLFTS